MAPSVATGLQLAINISALVGGGLAVWTFSRNVRVRRAEWLSSLHAKFFESDTYKKIRHVLDYEPEPEFTQLSQAVVAQQSNELTDAFFDYLNFFQLLATLWKLNQLRPKEISLLFDYYIALLSRHEFVKWAIAHEGFDDLAELLPRCAPKRRSAS